MSGKVLAGIVLIVIGVATFAVPYISFTQKEKVVDIGPVEITADKEKSIPLPPILGGALVLGGIVVLATSRK